MKIAQQYRVVPIDSIEPHPENPNQGDVEFIQESIQVNDWYGAVIVQTSTNRIIAGEHRWRAAQAEGAAKIPVIFRDVDDAQALKMLLVDNEAARRAHIDATALNHCLQTLAELTDDDLAGTGFSLDDIRDEADDEDEDLPDPGDDDPLDTQYGVVVMCDSEQHQEAIFNELSARGLKLRAVAV